MRYKHLFLTTILCLFIFAGNAQVIVKIGNDEILTEDFIALYQKNNDPDLTIEQLTKEEYLDLYINFKLKVKEAEALGMNQERSFIREFNGYRDQLVKPFLVDSSAYENLIKESYEHMKYDLRASHILINLPEMEVSSDTIYAWNKAISIRDKFLKGEDFGDLAYKYSDDPSARERDWDGRKIPANRGDLGYFSAFDMVYPFENVAYETKIGEVSMPVRSKFGYHIVYVTDRIPSLGECSVSHLLLRVPADATKSDSAKIMERAQALYDRMMKGENFTTLVKEYSEDKSTSDIGGQLRIFTSSKLEPTFIKYVSTLQNPGDISVPFFTPYGCHIVKLDKRGKLGTLEEETPIIKKRITGSDRLKIQNDLLYIHLRNEYNYKLNGDNYNEILPLIEEHFKNLSVIKLDENKELFTYSDRSASQNDFITYMFVNEMEMPTGYSKANILKYLDNFVNTKLFEIEAEKIANENSEFKLLLQEYYDGILLFNINDEFIWKKAMNDSLGLANYYEKNKDNYYWKERTNATLYTISDPSTAKKIRKSIIKGYDDKEIAKMYATDNNPRPINVEKRLYEQGENTVIDTVDKKVGISKVINNNGKTYLVKINEVIPPKNKTLSECRGSVISDYQTYLEDEWLKELKEKYPVVINYTELEKIK
ncbi:MAG: peptidylprolyl isomerase [Bacteroidales bacterium]|jgi:peptidyl-prolyl cis-trans isomerase SurA|nr:peptidylprolyl isomerase [Bacteroidales bacterium]